MAARTQALGDQRFIRLVGWELRHLRGQGSGRAAGGMALAGLVLAGAAMGAATQPLPGGTDAGWVQGWALAWLIATPLRDPVPDPGQLSYGYGVLRIGTLGLMLLARLAIPVLAAGVFGADRRAGRLEELQLALLRAREVYLAKTTAVALPFLAGAVALPVLFLPVLAAEGVPFPGAARLVGEALGQIVMTVAVTLACSAWFSARGPATVAAGFLLWLTLPLAWMGVLVWLEAVQRPVFTLRPWPVVEAEGEFWRVGAAQALLTGGVTLAAYLSGAWGLRRAGLG